MSCSSALLTSLGGKWAPGGRDTGLPQFLHPLALHNTSRPALAQPEWPLPANTQVPAPAASAGPSQVLSAPVLQGRHKTSGNHHVQRSAKLSSPEVTSLFLPCDRGRPLCPAPLTPGSCSAKSRGKTLSGNDRSQGIYCHRRMWRCHRAMALVPGTSQRHQRGPLCDAKRRHCSAPPVNPHWHFSPPWSLSCPAVGSAPLETPGNALPGLQLPNRSVQAGLGHFCYRCCSLFGWVLKKHTRSH